MSNESDPHSNTNSLVPSPASVRDIGPIERSNITPWRVSVNGVEDTFSNEPKLIESVETRCGLLPQAQGTSLAYETGCTCVRARREWLLNEVGLIDIRELVL